MSITDPGTIDIIATRPGSRVVKLVVTDHLDWRDLDGHAALLRQKAFAYADFVESGGLGGVRTPAIPDEPEVVISVVAMHPPPREADAFLAEVAAEVRARGLGFEVQIRS